MLKIIYFLSAELFKIKISSAYTPIKEQTFNQIVKRLKHLLLVSHYVDSLNHF